MRPNLHNVNYTDFIKIVKPEIAYFLGILWADGCIFHRKNEYLIKLTIVSDDMSQIKDVLEKCGHWNYSIYKSKNINWKEKTSAYIYSRPLYELLFENGYGGKSYESADKILNLIPISLHKFWWRGLFDGDGYFYGKKSQMSCGISSGYNQNWEYAIKFCENQNIRHKIYRYHRKGGSQSEFRFSSSKDMINFNKFIYDGYEDDKIGFNRKYENYLHILNNVFSKIKQKSSIYRGVFFMKDRNKWCVDKRIDGIVKRHSGFITELDAYNFLKTLELP